MEDLGINVAERVGTKENIGPGKKEIKSISFNAVAIVRATEDGKLEILGLHFMNPDKSMTTVKLGEVREISLKVECPK